MANISGQHHQIATRRAGVQRRGFTLAELIVATVIGVLVAGAAATSLSQMIKARGASLSRQQAFSRADSVVSKVAQDVSSAVRSANLKYGLVRLTPAGGGQQRRDELLVLFRSLRVVREGAVEGDEFEAQYRIAPATVTTQTGEELSDAFWRRVDPARDEYVDGGGVATPIAFGAVGLMFEAFNGEVWAEEWNSDSQGYPHAVRVTAIARSDDGRTTSTARRIIAIDRVPISVEVDEEAEEETEGATGSGAAGGTGSGTPSGGSS